MIGGDTHINVLRNIRDLDMFEMQRRGMTRWRAR